MKHLFFPLAAAWAVAAPAPCPDNTAQSRAAFEAAADAVLQARDGRTV